MREHSVDALAGQALWSEAVEMDCATPDSDLAFGARLCRYPTAGTSWLWARAIIDGRLYCYNDNYLPCTPDVTAVEAPEVNYALDAGPVAVFTRSGARDAVSRVALRLEVLAAADPHPPHGAGDAPVCIEAVMRAPHPAQATRRGRIEVFGDIEATIRVGDASATLRSAGKWHEQHQEAPRWGAPFTYVSLRNDRISLLATAAAGRAGGFLRRGDSFQRVTALTVDPPGPDRGFSVTLESGDGLEGAATAVHTYSVPIYDRRRPGSNVIAHIGDERLGGIINDWDPASPA